MVDQPVMYRLVFDERYPSGIYLPGRLAIPERLCRRRDRASRLGLGPAPRCSDAALAAGVTIARSHGIDEGKSIGAVDAAPG
jgi:hypothetical protein